MQLTRNKYLILFNVCNFEIIKYPFNLRVTNEKITANGVASIANSEKPNHLLVKFPGFDFLK